MMKYRSLKERALAFLLVLAMLMGFFPSRAQAEEELEVVEAQELTPEENTLELDVPVEITKEETLHYFTAPETGLYWVNWSVNDDIGWLINDILYMFGDQDRWGTVVELTAGESYPMWFYIFEWAEASTGEVMITKVEEATDIELPDGNEYTGMVGTMLDIPVELVGGTVLENYSVEVSDGSIVICNGYNTSNISIEFCEVGETQIRVFAENGIEQIIDVTCVDYGYDAVEHWEGTQQAETTVQLWYTPEEDGFYFLNAKSWNGPDFVVSAEGAQPAIRFWYKNSFGYTGYIYELEAEKAYCFESYYDYERSYDLYLIKTEVSNSISVPETLSGMVNQKTTLEVTLNGAATYTLSSSDENVVMIYDNKEILFVGEGTATITATNQNGVTDSCTVTVSGVAEKQSIDDSIRALGAGKSATYIFIPGESTTYWIKSHVNDAEKYAHPTITVFDVNGDPVDGYKYDKWSVYGKVYEFIGGAEYIITVASETATCFTLLTETAVEAEGITLNSTSVEGMQGDILECGYELTGEPSNSLVGNVTITSSDTKVAQIVSQNGSDFKIELVGGGTADVVLSLPNGNSATLAVSCKGIKTIEAGEELELTIDGYQEQYLIFEPEEDGTYLILFDTNQGTSFSYDLYGISDGDFVTEYWDSEKEQLNGKICYGLKAGAKYRIYVYNMSENTVSQSVTVVKTGAVTGFDIGSEVYTIYKGTYMEFCATFDSYLAMADKIEWTITDADKVQVQGGSITKFKVDFLNAGTYTVTATCNGITKKCVITVKEPTVMELEKSEEITTSEEHYVFTPEDSGKYWIYWPEERDLGYGLNCEENYEFCNSQYRGKIVTLVAGTTYDFVFSVSGDPISVAIKKVTEATDIVFPMGDTAAGYVGDFRSYSIELVGGEVFNRDIVTVTDSSVAYINSLTDSEISLSFQQEGETDVIFTLANGDQKVLHVVSGNYGYDAAAHWTGVQQYGTTETLTYTAEEDGFYFFNSSMGRNGFNIGDTGAQPLSSFDYDKNGYWGTVYELEEGKTYYFVRTDSEGEYDCYLMSVEKATSVTIPETLTGKLNREIWLTITADGANSTELSSSNEDILLLGDGNANGNRVYCVGTGTAVITLTDQDGNQDTCTITVVEAGGIFAYHSGTKALGAGKSITYSYTVDETGLKWIYTEPEKSGNPDLKMVVTDENGDEIEGFFYKQYGKAGVVCNLTAGEAYRITVSSEVSQLFDAGAQSVMEAEGITLYTDDVKGVQGDKVRITYDLTANNAPYNLVADIKVTASNPNVLKVDSATGEYCEIQLIGSGETQLQFAIGGNVVASVSVVSVAADTIDVNDEIENTLAPGEAAYYLFVPEEDGTYVVASECEDGNSFSYSLKDLEDEKNVNYSWNSSEQNMMGIVGYDMKAGKTYRLEVANDWGETLTGTAQIVKTGPVTGLELSEESCVVYTGDYTGLYVKFDSYMAMEQKVEWTVTGDVQIEWINDYIDQVGFNFTKTGTYIVTAKCGDVSDSCTIVVKEPTPMELDQKYEVIGRDQKYSFTAEEEGMYFISWPVHKASGGSSLSTAYYIFQDAEKYGMVTHLDASETTIAWFSFDENHDSVPISISKVTEATDIGFVQGDTVEMIPGQSADVFLELIGGDVIRLDFAESSNDSVARVGTLNGDVIALSFETVGEAVITIHYGNGQQKSFKAICKEYGQDAVAHWSGYNMSGDTTSLGYTAEKDGFYFFCSLNGNNGFEIKEDGTQPLSSFDYNELGYSGTVYELEAGKTYDFSSDNTMWYEYDMFLIEVQIATSVTIPEAISAKKNERLWLPITANGVYSTELSSSNENVVMIGEGDGTGYNLYFVGEGTAVITLTDQNGNTDTCTVTVSGVADIEAFQGYYIYAIGAGQSVSYKYTPSTTGVIAFRTGVSLEDLSISLFDLNGNPIEGYEYGDAKVYSVTKDTQYLLTFTSLQTCRFYTAVMEATEATGIELYYYEYEAAEGTSHTCWFTLQVEGTGYRVADLTITSSDTDVVQIVDCLESWFTYELVAEGEATITITAPNGVFAELKVTVTAVNEIVEDETIEVSIAPETTIPYKFTPEESGTYLMLRKVKNESAEIVLQGCDANGDAIYIMGWNSQEEEKEGWICYDLKAGETYSFAVSNQDYISDTIAEVELTLIKTGPVTSFEVTPNRMDLYEYNNAVVKAVFDSYLAMESEIIWSVQSFDTFGIGMVGFEVVGLELHLYGLGKGTHVVTARCAGFEDSCTIVVRSLQLDTPIVTASNRGTDGKVILEWSTVEDAVGYEVYRSDSQNGDYELLTATTATEYADVSAAAGSIYYYKVRATGDENIQDSEDSEAISQICKLARPDIDLTGVTSTGKTKINWEVVEGAVSYKVYRSTSKTGTYTLLKTTTAASYTDTSAQAGVGYYYKVMAVAENTAANSAYSAILLRTCDLPSPSIVVDAVASTGKTKVSWDEIEGAVGYKVYRSTSKTGTYTLLKTTTAASYTDTSAQAGVGYYYKVMAVAENTAANSAYSAILLRTCDLPSPSIAVDAVASTGKTKVSWDEVEGAVSYKVYRSTSKTGTYTLLKTTTAASYTDSSAQAGVGYYYKVMAVAENTAANSAYSAILLRTCDLPSPSIAVDAVASTGKTKVSWDEVEGAVSYKVYRSTSKTGTYTLLKTTTAASYTDTSAQVGVGYYYKVMAVAENTAANSAYSAILLRTCDLARPTIAVDAVASTGKTKVSWDEVEGAVSYKVYRSTSKTGTYTLLKTTTAASYTDTSAQVGVGYYYKVMAVAENTAANSAYSAILLRTCDLARPTIAVDAVASTGKTKVSWDEIEGAVSYKVYRSTSKTGTYTLLKTTTAASYTDTSAQVGVGYYYKVMAVAENTAANSAYSAILLRTCDLARPTIAVDAVASTGKTKVSWDEIEGAVSYKVYRSTSKTGTYTLLKTTTAVSYTDTSCQAGTSYYYKVMAVAENTAANSAYSSIKSRVCDLAQPVIKLSTVTSTGKNKVSWEKIDGAVKYEVYRATSKTGTYSLLKTTTALSYTDTSAKAGTTYYYKIRAVAENTAANSAYSAIKSIKTVK